MMAGKWLVYRGTWLEKVVAALDPGALIERPDDAFSLRNDLMNAAADEYSVALYGCVDMDPLNLAAALVKDGRAREVLLVVDETSGSLRSRATSAGVSRVLSREEADLRIRAVEPSFTAKEHSATSEMDIDEPGDIEVGSISVTSAPILTLASGRGGVGKSAIAATMALVASSWGMKVSLVDMDLSFGNLFGFFGLPGPVDYAPMIKDRGNLTSYGREVARNLVLYGPCGRPEFAETITPHLEELLKVISESSDLVIVDSASCWGEGVARVVQMSDRVLLACDERAGALGSLTRSGSLAVRLGVARTRIVRVMNRCDMRRRDETFLARADMGLETARSMRVMDGGSEVAELLSAGHIKELIAEDSAFVQSCASMAAKLLAELGALPDNEAARRARQMKEPRTRALSLFRGAV